MAISSFTKIIPDESSMLALGGKLASVSLPREPETADSPLVIFLHGQLGAGKTTLVRGFLRKLGFSGYVKSPSYTLVEPYELPGCAVFHFDFYRLHDPQELEFIGIQDYFTPHAICLIEWPEHGAGQLIQPSFSCYISLQGDSREVKLAASSARGEIILQRLQYEK
jgi:tRNA threonylcarbamoyladenosine biosynthesis protein TsaE